MMFSCPLLSEEERKSVSIPIENVDNHHLLCTIVQEHGYAIITGVLTPEECRSMEEQELAQDVHELVDTSHAALQEDTAVADPTMAPEFLRKAWNESQKGGIGAWPRASLNKLGPAGFWQLHGMPHSRFSWACRLHPNVRRVYQALHSKDDLVTGFDNAFVTGKNQPATDTNPFWPHVDMDEHERVDGHVWPKDARVYQGLLYIWPSDTEHASTTVLWPKSHGPNVYGKLQEACKGYRGEEDDSSEVEEDDPVFVQGTKHFVRLDVLERGQTRNDLFGRFLHEARRIPVPAGALLIWDSRIVHQGWKGGPRLAQPICWEPKSRRCEAARHRKLVLATLGLVSTHWASLGINSTEVSEPPRAVAPCLQDFGSYDLIVFPLRPTIKSRVLKDDVDHMQLWQDLQGVDLLSRPLPANILDRLEKSIKPEYLAVI